MGDSPCKLQKITIQSQLNTESDLILSGLCFKQLTEIHLEACPNPVFKDFSIPDSVEKIYVQTSTDKNAYVAKYPDYETKFVALRDPSKLLSEKKVTHLNIVGPDGKTVYKNVPITPFAENVILKDPEDNTISTSLQEFLFNKFDDSAGIRVPDGQYEVNPADRSIWQTWIDYQNMTKKRLMGLYNKDGEYTADFIAEKENDIQAEYTITEGEATNIGDANSGNIKAIIDLFGLTPKTPLDGSDTITAEDQAKELALHLGSGSVWQNIIEEDRKQRDMLWGIYDATGEIVGHFEPTEEDLNALNAVYWKSNDVKLKQGIAYTLDIPVASIEIIDKDGITEDNEAFCEFTYKTGSSAEVISATLKYSQLSNERTKNMLINFGQKSVYQTLIDLEDFWLDLPREEYDQPNEGISIATKYDINQLHFNL